MSSGSVKRLEGDEPAKFVPKRGRPSRDQIEAIDEIILRVARKMFLENGYGATSIEAIAAATDSCETFGLSDCGRRQGFS